MDVDTVSPLLEFKATFRVTTTGDGAATTTGATLTGTALTGDGEATTTGATSTGTVLTGDGAATTTGATSTGTTLTGDGAACVTDATVPSKFDRYCENLNKVVFLKIDINNSNYKLFLKKNLTSN